MTESTERIIAEAVSEIHERYRTGEIESHMSKMSQADFIAILFGDLGYGTAAQRKGWLQLRYGKNFADELTPPEASMSLMSLLVPRWRLSADTL